jgi:hypothetical protein
MWRALQAAKAKGRITLAPLISFRGLPQPSNPWILKAYETWERRRYLPPDNILEEIDLRGTVGEVVDAEEATLASHLASTRADVLIVAPGADQAKLSGIDIPIWRFEFGSTEPQHAAPGLWEVVDRSISSVSLVESISIPRRERVLETIVGRTDPRSWVRNQVELMSKASALLTRWLPPSSSRRQRIKPALLPNAHLLNGVNRRSSHAVLRLLARFGNHARTSALNVEQWQIALDTSPGFLQLDDPIILTPPVDRFWCDPFLLQRGDSLHVFVEEYVYSSGKGHIAVLSRSASGEWSGPITVLNRPYHLSYPSVFEYEGELLMLPETTAAGRVELYHCVKFPDQWELDCVLIDNFTGADATLWFQDARWWLFVDVKDELHLLHADSPRGPWQQHRGNPVKSDARSSRPAGRIFRHGQDTIRPSQDCSVQYGREVVFNKITKLNICEFEEVEIGRLRTPWNGNTACHTFNQVGGVTVVDRMVTRPKRSLRNR